MVTTIHIATESGARGIQVTLHWWFCGTIFYGMRFVPALWSHVLVRQSEE